MPNNCKYRSDDGMCALFSEEQVVSFCVDAPCSYEVAPPMTNADRIRAMSDEELAEWLSPIADCVRCYTWGKDNPFDMRPCYTGEKRCKQLWLDWLQEVSE